MKKAQRKIIEKVLNYNDEEVVIYEPITGEPYRLKKKYRANKPT